MQYASFGTRFLAVLIDGLILGAINFALGMVFGAALGQDSTANGLILNVVSIGISVGYVVFYQAAKGQTVGKKVMGIKVVDAQGKTPSAMTFFLREIVGKFISGLTLGIGYLMMLWDVRKQALHDKIASTFVVKA